MRSPRIANDVRRLVRPVAVGDRDALPAGPDPGEPARYLQAGQGDDERLDADHRASRRPAARRRPGRSRAPAATDGRKPQSFSTIRTAEPTAASPSTAPTERSMPPIRITNVIPTAMMPISDTARTTLARLSALRNRISPSLARREDDRRDEHRQQPEHALEPEQRRRVRGRRRHCSTGRRRDGRVAVRRSPACRPLRLRRAWSSVVSSDGRAFSHRGGEQIAFAGVAPY